MRDQEILRYLLTSPDSQLDATAVGELRKLLDTATTDDEIKTGLHRILDYCARYSLASSLVMMVLDGEWRERGGKVDDPAPWRDKHDDWPSGA